ncbi:TIGR04013 family B12-binding domain/radical SAM domain-containing protein [Caloramator sp. CAR-1]|uniref:TIGR04013 family B12-binding domain/radical SAM domain-containing protein n=1 Tax=Caloramator sp. CAR-1 TaxID=3062777 RepID=UPI0026E26462|nr:TIGR04013 family B12-binding domain/radical SAM domain-containing protein [Caloramator sp. CAR-1]MDO6355537.1 TIGR04013 family B12-binding domain/radical SAM domain-containing protein [Caloramator sp. CAR-1]
MKTCFVIYYNKLNRNSFNALSAALASFEETKDIPIYFIKKHTDLIKDLYEIKEKYENVVVGISFFTTQIWEVKDIVKSIKDKHKDVLLIAGGPHPTGDVEGTLRMGFDLVFVGEAEDTIVEFFKRVLKDEDYSSVKGLAYLKDDDVFYTGKREYVDLDKYPPFPYMLGKFGHIEITRGCPFACNFCQTSHIFGGKVRHRSIEKVLEAAERMIKRNLTDFRVITPNAFSYLSEDGREVNIKGLEIFLREVNRLYKPKGTINIGSFPSEVRPEHVREDTLELLKTYADNKNIIIGAQSGSPCILKNSRRGHTLEDVYRAVKLSVKYGYIPDVDFIFGLPGETERDVLDTIKFMKELANLGARIHAHTFMPLPQTAYSKEKPGRIDPKIKETISKMLKEDKNVVFGNWTVQERQAEKIYKYLNYGII